jgi:hypothetical protein
MDAKDKAIEAGIRLHDFIRTNTGENADWPLQISSPESGALEQLDTLLREFRAAALRL